MSRKKARMSLDERAALQAQRNPGIEYLRLGRREICRREITAAVRLFLIDEDPISAHLLASAAAEILTVLSNGRSDVGHNYIRNSLRELGIDTDEIDEVFQSLLHPYNFLKHSSSDFNIENEFSVDFIVMTIYGAIHSYNLMFADRSPEMLVFYGIVQSWRIEWWNNAPDYAERLERAQKFPLAGVSRAEFCRFGRGLIEMALLSE